MRKLAKTSGPLLYLLDVIAAKMVHSEAMLVLLMFRFVFALFQLPVLVSAQVAVDWVVSAGQVVTMDGPRRVIADGAVAVRGREIVAVGTRAEIAGRYRAKQTLARPNAVLMPGLVNTHAHVPMSLFRGVADDMRLQDWLNNFIFPAEAKNVTAEFVKWGTRLGVLEMLLGGTTTYTDMYYFEEVVAEETKRAGMRGVLGQTIIQFPVPDAKTPADGLRRTEAFFQKYANDPLITPAVAPHALYTNDDETLRACRRLADQYKKPLVIHLSETKTENDDIGKARGMSPTGVLDMLGIFNGPTVAAHGVWLDDADIKILAERGVGVGHCPSSNMKLASGVAPVAKMLAAGMAVGLGSDGPAGSNNDFGMFEEMDLAAKLAKVTSMDPEALPAAKVLEMATIGGARVLRLEKEIGSIEAGKRADLILVDMGAPHAQPSYNVVSQLVFALKASDVRDVMVDGKLVVRNRVALTLDRAAILAKAREYGLSVGQSLRK
jgi:5-methylthioadenosine/S-adenosylhomocysteine deaminase